MTAGTGRAKPRPMNTLAPANSAIPAIAKPNARLTATFRARVFSRPVVGLHDAGAQLLVLTFEQVLHEIVAAAVGIPRCAGEVMVDPRLR